MKYKTLLRFLFFLPRLLIEKIFFFLDARQWLFLCGLFTSCCLICNIKKWLSLGTLRVCVSEFRTVSTCLDWREIIVASLYLYEKKN